MAQQVGKIGKSRRTVQAVVNHGNLVSTYIPAGMAAAGPPLGPMLGQVGINIAAFCKDFNEKTKEYKEGIPLPCRVTVKPDRTYYLVMHKPPMSYYIKQAAGIERGAMYPGQEVGGKISLKHVYEIAQIKSSDPPLQITPIQTICKMVIGAAHSIGVEVVSKLEEEGCREFLEQRRLVVEQQLKELEEKKQAKMLRTATVV